MTEPAGHRLIHSEAFVDQDEPVASTSEFAPKASGPTRRTKRRYAHELYPHAEEGETRPLAVEVPYLYARAAGLNVWGTSWLGMLDGSGSDTTKLAAERINQMVAARRSAFIADALLQGMTGDEAWAWADQRGWDESGEWAYERAEHYGVLMDQIKPYACGPEPDPHDHVGEPDGRGYRRVTDAAGKESECPDCTEEVPAGGQ